MRTPSRKVYVESFGCQMNKLDTALVTSALGQAGFVMAEDIKVADAVLINTCSVRQHAEERVFSHLGHLKHIKETRPNLVVAVMGCMAQRLGAQLMENNAVDIVCGPAQISQITELLEKALQEKQKSLAVTDIIRSRPPANLVESLEEFEAVADSCDKQLPGQAFVRVMRGCNKFCSYCVVPYVRGPEVCRSPQAIMEQVNRLAGQGIKLITFLGQTVNSYKYLNGDKTWCLADLLELADKIDGIEWIRFVTSYPSEEFFGAILHAMAGLPKVCHYLHMPAQSGSDKILKAMHRSYTVAQYLDMLNAARAAVPDIAVAGDFIVGFPGETEEDFQQTVELVEKAQYKNCFVFKYSPRPGTAADSKLEDTIPAEIKRARNMQLLAVQEKNSERLCRQFLGKEIKVLVEGLSKKPHLNKAVADQYPQLIARTAEDWIVVFNGPQNLAGNFAKVKVNYTSPLTLFGHLLTKI